MMPPMRNASSLLSVLTLVGLIGATACAPAEDTSSAPAAAGQCTKDSRPPLAKGSLTFGTDQPA